MIIANIKKEFPHHLNHYLFTDKSIYVTDHTEQTQSRKAIEIFTGMPPTNIGYFSLQNAKALRVISVIFNNKSFTYPNGDARSQCECVIFPENNDAASWLVFLELKYSNNPEHNISNLKKAILQLYKTRTYYYRKKVFSRSNTCYLFVSLPMQREPFANFALPPSRLQSLKSKHNVVLRLKNDATIEDSRRISI